MTLFRLFKSMLTSLFQGERKFLCDTCKYDFGNACTRPERPNATKCPDYKRGGSK